MQSKQTLLEHMCDLALEVSTADQFEFPYGMDKRETYERVTEAVVTQYLSTAPELRDEVLLASNIHLLVENAVLNFRLLLEEGD